MVRVALLHGGAAALLASGRGATAAAAPAPPMVARLLPLMTLASVTVAQPTLLISMYSDAQCPCSAQFVSDVVHIMRAFNGTLDLEQLFVPKCMDALDTCSDDPAAQGREFLQCIHGDEECVGHRYFLCAQQQQQQQQQQTTLLPRGPGKFAPPRYLSDPKWLDFQRCSYGACQQCDVFTQLLCFTPCTTYMSFTKPKDNHIMQNCAVDVGLDWGALQRCAAAGAEEGDVLQRSSAAISKARNATYGGPGGHRRRVWCARHS
jgi:hypothetical protein